MHAKGRQRANKDRFPPGTYGNDVSCRSHAPFTPLPLSPRLAPRISDKLTDAYYPYNSDVLLQACNSKSATLLTAPLAGRFFVGFSKIQKEHIKHAIFMRLGLGFPALHKRLPCLRLVVGKG